MKQGHEEQEIFLPGSAWAQVDLPTGEVLPHGSARHITYMLPTIRMNGTSWMHSNTATGVGSFFLLQCS